jgi:hypothetical protein
MADEKLNLVVQFMALDGLSGAMKTIIGLSKTGQQELTGLKRTAVDLNKQMRDVQRQMIGASGNATQLINRERELGTAIEAVNKRIQQRATMNGIDARTAAMQSRGRAMMSEGQMGLMWGSMAMAPLYAMAKSAGEVEALTNRLRVLGLGDGAVRDLTAYAAAMHVAGSSVRDNMRYIVEAQGAFRESGAHTASEQIAGARLMAPIMAKMQFASKAMGHEISEDQERYFLRFVEQAGGMNDPHRAAALADGLFRALQSSGGNVDPSNYQAFLARAGTSGMRLSARSMFADFEPLIAELHESAGVGLMSAYSRSNGMIKNTAAGAEMMRLGMWDASKVNLNSLGGVKSFKNGENPLDANLANLLATDPVEFYQQLQAKYKKAGVTDVQRENLMLFGKTGGALFNLIDKQLPTILKARAGYEKTQGLEKAYGTTKDSFFGRQGQMTAAWQDFMVVAGSKGGLLDAMVTAMRAATSGLKALTAFGNSHPTAFRFLTTAVTSLIAMRIGLSIVRIGFGYLLGPVGQLWGIFSKYRALGSIAAAFPRLWTALRMVGTVGRWLLPIIFAIPVSWMLIGVAAVALGVLIYRNWDLIKATFFRGVAWVKSTMSALPNWMKSIGVQLMQGLLMAIDPMIFAHKMLDVAKTGVTAFKGYFGIKSPSRLMMEMGGHIATGLGSGIDQHQHRPTRAMTRMGAAMAGALSLASPATASGRGAAPITIHIHQQPGEDAYTLANRVVALLDRRGPARGGSSFADDF